MSLNIVPGDILNYLGQTFNAIFPILAIGLGLLAVPYVVRAARSVFTRK